MNYSYNVRGWLTDSNEASNTGPDKLFNFNIGYTNPQNGATPLYNGNISETRWRTANTDSALKSYSYAYDPLNRIISATDNTGKFDVSGITYDKNGNIQKLKREGWTSASPSLVGNTGFGTMDDLTYSYDSGNKLMKVADAAIIDQYGFKDDAINIAADTTDDYVYDPNGNMTQDLNKGIKGAIPTEKGSIYNHLNLPVSVNINSAEHTGTISYIYDATGVKLQKNVLKQGDGSPKYTDYAGNYIYENDVLQFFSHAEGYVEPNTTGGYDYIYQYKDHLGNIRLSYKNVGTATVDLEIQEENNYYPFGLKHKGYNVIVNSTNAALDYKYNGVEFEESLGLNLYEMDLRQYNPEIGRWIAIDPVTHYSASTYNAFDNNPIFFADPSGADSIYNFETGQYVINGTEVSFEEAMAYAQNGGNADGSNDNTSNKSKSNDDCCGEYVASRMHKMGPRETEYYSNHKDQLKIVRKAAFKAGILATTVDKEGSVGGDNFGYSGAIRHSYWMYLLAVELGPELAKSLGMLHEDYTIRGGKFDGKQNVLTEDSIMDQTNNAFGISIARKRPNLTELEFEEIFHRAAIKYQRLVKIYHRHTIPKETLKIKVARANALKPTRFVRFGE